MVLRVGRTTRELEMPEDVAALVDDVHEVAVEARRPRVPDDHHHAFLHPGRTALVLLGDADVRSVPVLLGGLILDSERPELEPAPAAVEEAAAPHPEGAARLAAARTLVSDAPRPGDEALAERLVTGSEALRLLVLCERLDQLRHAHLWNDAVAAREAHEEARTVYLPVSERTHPVLARRYAWWCRTFARRRG